MAIASPRRALALGVTSGAASAAASGAELYSSERAYSTERRASPNWKPRLGEDAVRLKDELAAAGAFASSEL
jgi:hypothetical protein